MNTSLDARNLLGSRYFLACAVVSCSVVVVVVALS